MSFLWLTEHIPQLPQKRSHCRHNPSALREERMGKKLSWNRTHECNSKSSNYSGALSPKVDFLSNFLLCAVLEKRCGTDRKVDGLKDMPGQFMYLCIVTCESDDRRVLD
jgi:hypothetical protein